MTAYASRSEIIDAIERSVLTRRRESDAPANIDGTYRLIPTWIGSTRVWMAEPITETSGFEIAYEEVWTDEEGLQGVKESDRFGAWYDPTDGTFYLDRTMHVRGTMSGVAHDIARLYSQKAIWSWHGQKVEEVEATCTAL